MVAKMNELPKATTIRAHTDDVLKTIISQELSNLAITIKEQADKGINFVEVREADIERVEDVIVELKTLGYEVTKTSRTEGTQRDEYDVSCLRISW